MRTEGQAGQFGDFLGGTFSKFGVSVKSGADCGSAERNLALFTRMTLIRSFERKVQELFSRGRLPGFVHLYVGEEAIAVGACSVLRRGDKITSTIEKLGEQVVTLG